MTTDVDRPPTYQELREERAQIAKEIAQLDRDLIKLRGLRLEKWKHDQAKRPLVDRLTELRADLSILNTEIADAYPQGARSVNDDGRKFWRDRAFSLVQSMDAILDDETASPTVKAIVAAAQREYARAMSSHGSGEQP